MEESGGEVRAESVTMHLASVRAGFGMVVNDRESCWRLYAFEQTKFFIIIIHSLIQSFIQSFVRSFFLNVGEIK